MKDLVKLSSLWSSGVDMQTFCLDNLAILRDEKQWNSWIAKTLAGKRAAKALNAQNYKDYFKTVAPSVQSSSQQQTFTVPLVPEPDENSNGVGAAIPIASFVGRGGKITLSSSPTELQINREVVMQNRTTST